MILTLWPIPTEKNIPMSFFVQLFSRSSVYIDMNDAAITNDSKNITVRYSYLDEGHVRVDSSWGASLVMTNEEAEAHRQALLADGGRES